MLGGRRLVPVVKMAGLATNPLSLLIALVGLRKSVTVRLRNGLSLTINEGTRGIAIRILYNIVRLRAKGIEIEEQAGRLTVMISPTHKLDFEVSNFSSVEILNLVELILFGVIYGVQVMPKGKASMVWPSRSLTLDFNTKILETHDGCKFNLADIQAYTLIETFYMGMHSFLTEEDMTNQTVLDVGAQAGDTAVYFARKGALVFAVEPVEGNFNALLRNVQLNRDLSHRIRPIRAAIGKTGPVTMYTKEGLIDGGASAYYKMGPLAERVQSYTMSELLEREGMKSVDILKMDCKGCELELKPEDLARIRRKLEIAYTTRGYVELNGLISLIEDAGFDPQIIRLDPLSRSSVAKECGIFASRKIP